MRIKDAISLGRVSNLPTVWTNTLAAFVLSQAEPVAQTLLLTGLAMSLFYTGGMYLNDAFDRKIDARERPERPIPSGRVSARSVFTLGFAQLAAGIASSGALAACAAHGAVVGPIIAAFALAGIIVLYDVFHKRNPLSPLLMGLCRVMVYVTVALIATGSVPGPVWVGAAMLLSYLIGLTYVAKQENLTRLTHLWPLVFLAVPFVIALLQPTSALAYGFVVLLGLLVLRALWLLRAHPPHIRQAVVTFIAGIALLDATLIAMQQQYGLALVCVAGFALTLLLQGWVRGT